MKIAIFGSGGLLGSDLVSIGKEKPHQIIAYHRNLDMTNLSAVVKQIAIDRPDWVINAAGHSHVDEAEKNTSLAFALNQLGAKNIMTACAAIDIPIIHLSTDYVFPGDRQHVKSETDPIFPVNQYGLSKAAGEKEVAQYKKHYILRVSSLYGMGRDNHALRVMQGIKSGTVMKLATDMICSPTYTLDLANWIFDLISKNPAFGIYHVAHKSWCSRFDFALKMFEFLGDSRTNLLQPIEINSLSLPAKRPLSPLMSTEKWEHLVGPLKKWEDGLRSFLNNY